MEEKRAWMISGTRLLRSQCVCVCERESERERESIRYKFFFFFLIGGMVN